MNLKNTHANHKLVVKQIDLKEINKKFYLKDEL